MEIYTQFILVYEKVIIKMKLHVSLSYNSVGRIVCEN